MWHFSASIYVEEPKGNGQPECRLRIGQALLDVLEWDHARLLQYMSLAIGRVGKWRRVQPLPSMGGGLSSDRKSNMCTMCKTSTRVYAPRCSFRRSIQSIKPFIPIHFADVVAISA
jgi:hypothetical protein